jgi:hypothetical protein
MDIIGFNAQINAPKFLKRAKAMSNKIAPKPVVLKRVANKPVMVKTVKKVNLKPMPVTVKPVTVKPVMVKTIAKGGLKQRLKSMPVTAKPITNVSLVKKVSVMPVKPAQVPYKMSAKTTTEIKPTSKKADTAPLAIVKPSGKSIPLSTLENTTNPSIVKSVTPTQRSYMPVDLPYQTPTPSSQIVKIPNTNFGYQVNTDMVEPRVDSGVNDYYDYKDNLSNKTTNKVLTQATTTSKPINNKMLLIGGAGLLAAIFLFSKKK